MVRHKTRWLLVRLVFERDVLKQTNSDGSHKRRRDEDDSSSAGLTKKDLSQSIRDSISSSFGIAASGIAQDVQGMSVVSVFGWQRALVSLKSFDALIGTLLVRLYDESSRLAMIRVSRDSCGLVRAAITFLTAIKSKSVVASVIAVNGSARTAKRVALLEMRRHFREECFSTEKRELKDLEERLALIRKVE